MKRLEDHLVQGLSARLPRGRQAAIDELVRLGLIDLRRVEELLLKEEVVQHIRRGERVVDALMLAAATFCCSYEKARHIYYKKP
ncbi:MAG: hypothetical protein IIW59_02515 [Alistipes sp.]|nr:hypothetical protein [Alistipes sp.]